MKKVSQVTSKYHFTKLDANRNFNQLGMDHILRMSAIDVVRTMPLEDLKKLFSIEKKEPIKAFDAVYEYEIVVSIEIPD
ncbi:hypothetical protein D3C87_1063000 [compost metagenome]